VRFRRFNSARMIPFAWVCLDHVDAAIRLFDPNYDVEGIRQKIPTAAHRALRGR
jgi:hypothetical protein